MVVVIGEVTIKVVGINVINYKSNIYYKIENKLKISKGD